MVRVKSDQIEAANMAFKSIAAATAKSDRAQTELIKQVDFLQQKTQELLNTAVIKEPVTPAEKCMSPVLKNAIRGGKAK